MPEGTLFHAVKRSNGGGPSVLSCPTCGHPIEDTPCIHKLHPELFHETEDGLLEQDK